MAVAVALCLPGEECSARKYGDASAAFFLLSDPARGPMKRQEHAARIVNVHVAQSSTTPSERIVERALVLVIDDDPDARSIWVECLSHLGYRTVCASTGEEGIRVAAQERPTAILMDLSMPGIGGIEATRRIKADLRTRDSLVIVVSAHEPSIFAEARTAGCDAYFCKPFNAFGLDGILRVLTTSTRGCCGSAVVKRCACGRCYTRDEWSMLRLYGGMQIPDSGEAIEVRTCACGSYILMRIEPSS
jgi:two-component system cell cycle response regulator DivK